MSLTFKDVSEILKIIDESDVAELVVEIGDTKIVVRRNTADTDRQSTTPAAAPSLTPDLAPSLDAVPSPPAAESDPPASPDPAIPTPDRTGMTTVSAPMVGTFYRRPGPQDPPFVEVGDDVAAGDPIGLIEVMKLFTTLEAPVAGRIAEITAENEALVQIDELLIVIDPA